MTIPTPGAVPVTAAVPPTGGPVPSGPVPPDTPAAAEPPDMPAAAEPPDMPAAAEPPDMPAAAEPPDTSLAAGPSPGLAARRLLRAARQATLATQSDGQPFASLVTPATLPDGSVLLLLSGLSEHTRHLRAEPRCALLVTGTADGANPQTTPRVTLTGLAAPLEDPAAKARWVALHPYAAFYAELGDFSVWRMEPRGGLFVGGFARAYRLRQEVLRPDPGPVAAIVAAEAGIIGHCNADHAEALARIATRHGAAAGAWVMVAADVDGFDLCCGETVLRVPFSAPVTDSRGVRAELVRLAQAA
ncbi:MAG: DUF2470 domain-containing protein [Janthinobacterium lividum]